MIKVSLPPSGYMQAMSSPSSVDKCVDAVLAFMSDPFEPTKEEIIISLLVTDGIQMNKIVEDDPSWAAARHRLYKKNEMASRLPVLKKLIKKF